MFARVQCCFLVLAATSSLLLGQSALRIDLREGPREMTYSRYLGSFGNGRFGVPVCGGHDCDGDGFIDTALAAPSGSPFNRTAAGNVTIVWGRGGGFGETLDTEQVGDRLLHIAGSQALEACGAEIWMDDVDGDGLGDLLIGRQNFTPAVVRRGAGALTVIFGGPHLRRLSRENRVLDLLNPPEDLPRFHVFGARAYDRMGIWMRTGDLDGDGIADIAVGADEVDGEANERNRGEVILIRGGAHLRDTLFVDLVDYPPDDLPEHVMRIQPPPLSPNAHFGATVHLGDLDGNGRAELLVAATLDRAGAAIRLANAPAGTGMSTGGLGRGMTFILWDTLFSPERWESGAEVRISGVGPDVSSLAGGVRNLRLGEEIIAGGDYDGDGRPDLFVGDLKGSSKNGTAAGLGYVFFDAAKLRSRGLSMDALPGDIRHTVIEGVAPGAFSADAAAFGDLDDDGIDDLIITSPHEHALGRINAGSLHALYGQRSGWPEEINLAANALPDEVRIMHMIGARGNTLSDIGDTLGYSLAVADTNGDGTPDIITNEMQGNGARKLDVGNLVIYNARALFPPPNNVSMDTFTAMPALDGAVTIRWRSRWRTQYEVERSADLQAWEKISDPVLGSGEDLEVRDESAGEAPSFFYRLSSETVEAN